MKRTGKNNVTVSFLPILYFPILEITGLYLKFSRISLLVFLINTELTLRLPD